MRRRFLVGLLVSYAAVVSLLVIAPRVLADRLSTATAATVCTGTLTHVTVSGISVPAGAVCRVSGSTVGGPVSVDRDAYFEAWDTKINGTVHATGALSVFLHDQTVVNGSVVVEGIAQLFLYKTSVSGTVTAVLAGGPGYGHVQVCDTSAGGIEIRESGPDVLVGDPAAGCPGNRVANNVVIVGNDTASELDVSSNTITGSLTVTGNRGASPKRLMNNTVAGQITVWDNTAPFDSSGNGAET